MMFLLVIIIIMALLIIVGLRLDFYNNFNLPKLCILLLVLNLLGVVITFGITMIGPGGEVGMLPFVVLPYFGLISITLLFAIVITSILIKKSVFTKVSTIGVVLLLFLLGIIEISPFLIAG